MTLIGPDAMLSEGLEKVVLNGHLLPVLRLVVGNVEGSFLACILRFGTQRLPSLESCPRQLPSVLRQYRPILVTLASTSFQVLALSESIRALTNLSVKV